MSEISNKLTGALVSCIHRKEGGKFVPYYKLKAEDDPAFRMSSQFRVKGWCETWGWGTNDNYQRSSGSIMPLIYIILLFFFSVSAVMCRQKD